jgi:hypothetical protein
MTDRSILYGKALRVADVKVKPILQPIALSGASIDDMISLYRNIYRYLHLQICHLIHGDRHSATNFLMFLALSFVSTFQAVPHRIGNCRNLII